MKEQKIVIEIDREGQLTADAEGFTGDACMKDIERLLEGLGATFETVSRKPEAGERRLSTRGTITTGKKR